MKKQPNKTKKIILNIIKAILIIFFLFLMAYGIYSILLPRIEIQKQDDKINQAMIDWEDSIQTAPTTPRKPTIGSEIQASNPNPEDEDPVYPELLEAMKQYNLDIYDNDQIDLGDAWSYTDTSGFKLSDYGVTASDVVGTISIPKIGIELPLYLGASYENLSKGFAQLNQTSMPIGGTGTNCVVACHRGWNGSAFMRDADQLRAGDIVILRNFWETLTYEVREIVIIEPHEIDMVKIQPGKDMLTIVTCTPYLVGTHRMLIFAERVTEPNT